MQYEVTRKKKATQKQRFEEYQKKVQKLAERKGYN